MSSLPTGVADPIFHPLDLMELKKLGAIVEVKMITGYRLHKSMCFTHEDITRIPSPLEMEDDFVVVPSLVKDYLDVPAYRVSFETLIYIGFTGDAATLMWNRWKDWWSLHEGGPEGDNMNLLSIVHHHIATHAMGAWCEVEDAKWRIAMTACGIAEDIQVILMDGTLGDPTGNVTEFISWLFNILSASYNTLGVFRDESHERAVVLSTSSSGEASSNF